MKQGVLFFLLFVAGAQCQSTPREHFDSICPSQNGQIAEIRPGYHVRYRCDYLGSYGSPTLGNICSPGDCAERCRDTLACSGSTWNYSAEKCVLSGEGRARPLSGALYMEAVESSSIVPQPTLPDTHQQDDSGTTDQIPAPTDAYVLPAIESHVRACPVTSERLDQPKPDPIVVADPLCPTDNGNIFVAGDGAYYTLLRCTHNPNGNSEIPNTRSVVSSMRECATRCSSTSGCRSYVHSARANSADSIGTCKLYTTGSFQTTPCGDDTHDYGYITAPPAISSPDRPNIACLTECPLSDGQQYKSKGGELFHIDCGKRHGTGIIHETNQETFQDCIDSCSSFIPCHSVDYHTNSKSCYYGNHHGEPEISAQGFQSAHSLGCAEACSKDCATCCSQENTATTSA